MYFFSFMMNLYAFLNNICISDILFRIMSGVKSLEFELKYLYKYAIN